MGRPAATYYDMVTNPMHVDHTPFIPPHPVSGPILSGDTSTVINGRFAARAQDVGVHAGCCGPNVFTITGGSPVVQIGGKPAARQGDPTLHCGAQPGTITGGSPNVLIGDAPYGGAGSPVAPTPRVAEEARKRDELSMEESAAQAAAGDTASSAEKTDTSQAVGGEEATGATDSEKSVPDEVRAEPTEALAQPDQKEKTPEAVAEQAEQAEKEARGEEKEAEEQKEPVPVVAGTLVDDAGTPIPFEEVTLIASDGETEIARTTTDANGQYLFRNIEAGEYQLGVIDASREEVAVPAEPTAGAASGVVSQPEVEAPAGGVDDRYCLLLRLVDGGLAPQAGEAYRLRTPTELRQGKSDERGLVYELGLEAGDFEIEVAGQKHTVPSVLASTEYATPYDVVLEETRGAAPEPFLQRPTSPGNTETVDWEDAADTGDWL